MAQRPEKKQSEAPKEAKDAGTFYHLVMSCPVCGKGKASIEWNHIHDYSANYLEINQYGYVQCNDVWDSDYEKHGAAFSEWRWNCKGQCEKDKATSHRTGNPWCNTAEIGENDEESDATYELDKEGLKGVHKPANAKYLASALAHITKGTGDSGRDNYIFPKGKPDLVWFAKLLSNVSQQYK